MPGWPLACLQMNRGAAFVCPVVVTAGADKASMLAPNDTNMAELRCTC